MDSSLIMRVLLTTIFFLCLAFLPLLYLIARKLNKTLTMLFEETKRKNYLSDQNHQLKEEIEHLKDLVSKEKAK